MVAAKHASATSWLMEQSPADQKKIADVARAEASSRLSAAGTGNSQLRHEKLQTVAEKRKKRQDNLKEEVKKAKQVAETKTSFSAGKLVLQQGAVAGLSGDL